MKRKSLFFLIGSLLFSGIIPATTSCSRNVDYFSEVHFDLDKAYWENTNFLQTGCGIVTLKKGVDGDTAHFYTSTNEFLSGRFNGINTPESTGKLEEWGKAASKYTTGLLENAQTILLETDRGPTNGEPTMSPEMDGNGRYLVWVWISDRPVEEEDGSGFRLVNLGVVQNGFSAAKSISGTYYEDVFLDADAQAQREKLHIWSKEIDPDFNYGGPTIITLKEFWSDPEQYAGGYYCFEAIVTKVVGANAYVEYYEANEFTEEIERFGMYVFTMYDDTNAAKYFKIGRKLHIVANISLTYGSYQAHNTKFPLLISSKDPDKHTYFADNVVYDVMPYTELTSAEFTNPENEYDLMHTLVKISGLTVTYGYGGTDEIDNRTGTYYKNNAITLNCEDSEGNDVQVRLPDEAIIKNTDGGVIRSYTYFTNLSKNGVTFDFVGFKGKYENDAGKVTLQLMLYSDSDITYHS